MAHSMQLRGGRVVRKAAYANFNRAEDVAPSEQFVRRANFNRAEDVAPSEQFPADTAAVGRPVGASQNLGSHFRKRRALNELTYADEDCLEGMMAMGPLHSGVHTRKQDDSAMMDLLEQQGEHKKNFGRLERPTEHYQYRKSEGNEIEEIDDLVDVVTGAEEYASAAIDNYIPAPSASSTLRGQALQESELTPGPSTSSFRRQLKRVAGDVAAASREGHGDRYKSGANFDPSKQVPALAPLLTTDRSIRIIKRIPKSDLRCNRHAEGTEVVAATTKWKDRSLSRNHYMVGEDGRQAMMVLSRGEDQQILYETLDLDGSDYQFDEGDYYQSAGMDLQEATDLQHMSAEQQSHQDVRPDAHTPKTDRNVAGDGTVPESTGDDEPPPQLEPEGDVSEVKDVAQSQSKGSNMFGEEYELVRVSTPNGTEKLMRVSATNAYEMVEEGDFSGRQDLRTIEFNFLDSDNVCCGLCGEIVPYDSLLSDHLPGHHPEVLEDGNMDFEEVSSEAWLKEKLSSEKKRMESGSRGGPLASSSPFPFSENRVYRTVSQIRVSVNEMTLDQLLAALRKKMFEKLGREVPVTLLDKQHARCGMCDAVVSLNKKFETIHLVRHFNAWHPAEHKCAGTWKDRKPMPGTSKVLSILDFAVIDTTLDRGANLQCIWCGMFLTTDSLGMHFTEVHPSEVEVPKCNLCLQELVLNARLKAKYDCDFEVSLPDEHHIKCGKYSTVHSSEERLHAAIEKRMKAMELGGSGVVDDDEDELGTEQRCFNSRMKLGRRSKPKRQFIRPSLRQAAPLNSRYVHPLSECHWECKLCKKDIMAAVISAGAIRHFRAEHPHQLEDMQYELCKARLERISDGCMEFVDPATIECLVCNMHYVLHKPFNMCRAIRHLKTKHPGLMPENLAAQLPGKMRRAHSERRVSPSDNGSVVIDPVALAYLKSHYGVSFDKARELIDVNGETVYVLMDNDLNIDSDTADQLAEMIASGEFEEAEEDTQTLGSPEAPASSGQQLMETTAARCTRNTSRGDAREGINVSESRRKV